MRSYGFFLKETLDGIRQHSTGSLVTFLQVFISLFFLAMSLLVITNVNHIVDGFLNNLEVKAFLQEEVTLDEAKKLIDDVTGLNGVNKVDYVSKEEAFAIMQNLTAMDLSDLVETNPLPASLKITVTSPKAAKEIAEKVSLFKGVEDVRFGEEHLAKILPGLYLAELFSFLLAIFIAVVTLMTIGNTVRLAIYARRKEIQIMQLVGATSWFIRIPFMMEGLIYGLVGASLSLFSVGIVYKLVVEIYTKKNVFNPLMIDSGTMFFNLAIMLFILGSFIGIIASLIAVGKHLEEEVSKTLQPKGAKA